MLRVLGLLALILALTPFTSAHAATSTSSYKQPDLISFGAGYFDFDKSGRNRQAADMRLDYRWGMSLLPKISSSFNSWDPYVQFHPYAGLEVTTRGMLYGNGGWAMDWFICPHTVLTWSEGIGLYNAGDMTTLGSVVEFRSMLEMGFRFDNAMRLTAEISHISNAGLTNRNPGAEIAGIYFHVPVNLLFGGSDASRQTVWPAAKSR